MKPWSEESQEALKTLLLFYKDKDFLLPKCPLCEAVSKSGGLLFTDSNCEICPWVVMTNKRCFEFYFGGTNRKGEYFRYLPEALRSRVNMSVEDGFEVDSCVEKVIKKRIKQIDKWIKCWEDVSDGNGIAFDC